MGQIYITDKTSQKVLDTKDVSLFVRLRIEGSSL